MRQYFYIVAHTIVGDDQVIDKVFLQEYDAIRWGKTLATKHPEYTVSLYKQEIARTATVTHVKELKAFKDLYFSTWQPGKTGTLYNIMEQYLDAKVKRYIQGRLFSQVRYAKTFLGLAGPHPFEYLKKKRSVWTRMRREHRIGGF